MANLHGGVYGELAFHPLQAILDDDLAGAVGRFVEGASVNGDTLATDLINEVGPIPGHFLNTDHTRRWFDREGYRPKAADLLTYQEWENGGRRDALAIARDRMSDILKTHTPVPLPEDQDREIERILVRARAFYADR